METKLIYTHRVQWDSDEFNTATATTVEEALKLGDNGWEKWDEFNGIHIWRKRK